MYEKACSKGNTMKAKNVAAVGLVVIIVIAAVWPVWGGQGEATAPTIPLPKEVVENKELFQGMPGADTLLATAKGSLLGLEGVYVFVEYTQQDMEKHVTAQEVKTDVELLLRQYGIKVLSEDQRIRTQGQPYLYVNISYVESYLESAGAVVTASNISLELKQDARLERYSRIVSQGATTWGGNITMLSGGEVFKDSCKESLESLVKGFINDYLAANPTKGRPISPAVKPAPRNVITGIVFSDNPVAMIGGRIVHQGDIIGGAAVIKIEKDKVHLAKDGKQWTVGIGETPTPDWE